MNRALFRHTWRTQRLKLIVVSIALIVWGFLMPLVYGKFGAQFREVIESGIFLHNSPSSGAAIFSACRVRSRSP